MKCLEAAYATGCARFCCACFHVLAWSDKRWYLYAARVSLRCGVKPPQKKRPLRGFKHPKRYRSLAPLATPRLVNGGRQQAGGACVLRSAFCVLNSSTSSSACPIQHSTFSIQHSTFSLPPGKP